MAVPGFGGREAVELLRVDVGKVAVAGLAAERGELAEGDDVIVEVVAWAGLLDKEGTVEEPPLEPSEPHPASVIANPSARTGRTGRETRRMGLTV